MVVEIISFLVVTFVLSWPFVCLFLWPDLEFDRGYSTPEKREDERGITFLCRKVSHFLKCPIIVLRRSAEGDTARSFFVEKFWWLFGKETDSGNSTVSSAKSVVKSATNKISDKCYDCGTRVRGPETSPADSETIVTQCPACEEAGPERSIIIVEETAGDIGDFTIRRRGYDEKPYGWDILLTEIDEDAIERAREKILRLEVAERALTNVDMSDRIQKQLSA